jgi:hypothetical protein
MVALSNHIYYQRAFLFLLDEFDVNEAVCFEGEHGIELQVVKWWTFPSRRRVWRITLL